MSRLKKRLANHVSPYMHKVVEDMVSNPNKEKEEDRDYALLLAKQLFAERGARVHESNAVYRFAEEIRNGVYDYISSISEANNHLDEWISARDSFLAKHKIIAKKKIKLTNKEKMIVDSYNTAKELINAISIVPRVSLIELIAQDIERGDYEDISSLNDAKKYWKKWVERTRSILKARNVILDYR